MRLSCWKLLSISFVPERETTDWPVPEPCNDGSRKQATRSVLLNFSKISPTCFLLPPETVFYQLLQRWFFTGVCTVTGRIVPEGSGEGRPNPPAAQRPRSILPAAVSGICASVSPNVLMLLIFRCSFLLTSFGDDGIVVLAWDSHTDQWNRTESPEVDACSCGHDQSTGSK